MHARLRAILCSLACLLPLPGASQTVLDRPPLLSGGWIGTPGSLQITTPFRFSGSADPSLDVFVVPTFGVALGLPHDALVGGHYAPMSPVMGDDEWEAFARWRPLAQANGAPVDATVQAGFNGAARSLDAEAALARWIGPLRLLGAARVFSDAYGSGETRFAVAGGAVWYPAPRRMPIALAGDVGTLLDAEELEELAWSAGVQVGIPYTVNTVSLFATNTGSGTLQGVSLGGRRTRWGLELTLPIPLGTFLGWYPSREEARRAVAPPPAPPASVVRATIYRYAFVQDRLEVAAGTTIEWTNLDAMVHTATADDNAWSSGAIQPGASWSATFSQPGIYPYHCGPHAFMKAVVIVR